MDDTPSLQAVQDVVDFLLAANDPALTGEYCGGDSFAEWCEPYSGQSWYAAHGRALHLYFHAPDLPAAILVGQRISALVHRDSPRNSILTTGGDWAEYAEIWQPEHR